MLIKAEGNEIVIRLTIEEATKSGVDHGEYEGYIEVEDTFFASEDLGRALREAKRFREMARNQETS